MMPTDAVTGVLLAVAPNSRLWMASMLSSPE